jgi:topoisomerase IV subunit B
MKSDERAPAKAVGAYDESSIRSLDWKEHIRSRPGMYIGKLGDGSADDDGVYVLLKEIMDNSIDEYRMGAGKRIEVKVDYETGLTSVRDFGRGIPLGKVVDCVSKINTGGKYDSQAFQKSIGLNGVGTKAVNALSASFRVRSVREGKYKEALFSKGQLLSEGKEKPCAEESGTLIEWTADPLIFGSGRDRKLKDDAENVEKSWDYRLEYLEEMLWNYAFLNRGLQLFLNGKLFLSKNGLKDLLERRTSGQSLRYPLAYFESPDLELVMSHGDHSGELIYSFVNGQYTSMGGTHQAAFREAIVKMCRDFYKKNFEPGDVRQGIIAALVVRIQEPVFESQTKTKLGSTNVAPNGPTMKAFVSDYVCKQLDNFLHRNPDSAAALKKRIEESERERSELAGIRKLAKERSKKAEMFNSKLRDCRIHLGDKHKDSEATMIFITEGDSASGSLTKTRNPLTQAVFSLKGKPQNSYGMSKKVCYENEELNLLQHALNLEEGLEGLRYNKVILATDADVDGMHIRLLLMTFFLQFYPEVVEKGHLYILETPLFRVRNKRETHYCYSNAERDKVIKKLATPIEITRFKGLGEISPDEFKPIIDEDKIRLLAVKPTQEDEASMSTLLSFYMGKNTPDRKKFIVENLRTEEALLP